MKKILGLALILSLFLSVAQADENLLLDDFEGSLTGGADGTVDFGAGGGSTLDVSASTDIKNSGEQSLKAEYDAISGGYMWIAKGFGLDAGKAAWLIKPEDIDWAAIGSISFYMYGSNSGTKVAFDIKDKGNEIWRTETVDNFTGWKQIILPFSDFYPRGDWQPGSAEKNDTLDYPLKSYQFEPLPVSKGVLYFDKIELIKK